MTNPFTAAVEALRRLDVSRMALLTPYRDELNLQMRGLFEKEGIEVPAMASFNVDDDNLVGRISPDSIESAVLEIGGHSSVDAVFVACTNLRIAETIHSLEKQLGKPVTSSNHAMAWHALHLAGLSNSQKGWGRLFDQTW